MKSPAFLKIAGSGIVLASVITLAGAAAYMRDSNAGTTLATFTTNGIDLRIDSKAWYNGTSVSSATWAMKNLTPGTDKFFNFNDVKPGDFGCNVISMHVQKGDAWLCLDFKNLSNKENGINEPESHADINGTTTGELANGLQFFGWIDDGDGKYKSSEKAIFGTSSRSATTVLNNKSYSIGDSKNFGSCKQNNTRYVGMCWCAGTLTVNMNTGKMSCDGSTLGNAAQTDTVSVDVLIRAASSSADPKFLCNPTPPPPPPPHVPKDKNECKDDGWKSCGDERGSRFKSQNECNGYVDSHDKKRKSRDD